MLNQIDLQRLDQLKNDIALLELRFPVATIAKRTGINKGNVSKVLNGKVPCGDNFHNRFYASFSQELETTRANEKANASRRELALNPDTSEKLQIIANALSELSKMLYQLA